MTEEHGTKLKLELVAPGLWVVKGWKPPGIEDFFKVSEVYSKPRPKNVRKEYFSEWILMAKLLINDL